MQVFTASFIRIRVVLRYILVQMNTVSHPFEQTNSLFWYFSTRTATSELSHQSCKGETCLIVLHWFGTSGHKHTNTNSSIQVSNLCGSGTSSNTSDLQKLAFFDSFFLGQLGDVQDFRYHQTLRRKIIGCETVSDVSPNIWNIFSVPGPYGYVVHLETIFCTCRSGDVWRDLHTMSTL